MATKKTTRTVLAPSESRSDVISKTRYALSFVLLPLLLAGVVSCAGVTGTSTTKGGGTSSDATISASAKSLSFGQQQLSKASASQTLTVTNTGSAQVAIQSVTSSNNSFTTSGPTLPVSIPASQSIQIAVTFEPKTAGTISGNLTLATDTSSDALSVALSGTGAAAEVSVSPSTIGFGSEVTGTKSAAQTITLKNPGLMALTVSAMTASEAQFVVSGPAAPQTVQPGASIEYKVSFNPAAAQTYSGKLSFTTNAASGNGAVTLTGTGISGSTSSVAVSPTALSFGSQTVNSASGAKTVTLKNGGTATATIQAISSNNSAFAYSGLTLPATIPAAGSVQVSVTFDPKSAGAISGSLSVTGTASGLPASVALSGTGTAATTLAIGVSPTSVSFGSQAQNTTSGSQSIVVSNTGSQSLSVTGINITPAQFNESGPTPPYSILPGANVTYNVTFDPSAAQSYTGTFSVTSSATSGTSSASLAGAGAEPLHSVVLNWVASTSSVVGYNVYRSTVSGSGYAKVNFAPVAGVTYTDTTVQNSQTYYYTATSVDSNGDESVFSNQIQMVIP